MEIGFHQVRFVDILLYPYCRIYEQEDHRSKVSSLLEGIRFRSGGGFGKLKVVPVLDILEMEFD